MRRFSVVVVLALGALGLLAYGTAALDGRGGVAEGPADTPEEACARRRDPAGGDRLQTSARREPVAVNRIVQFGLRDKLGEGTRRVRAEIVAPGRGVVSAVDEDLSGTDWTYVPVLTEVPGIYRVDWLADDGSPLACDAILVR